VTAEFNSVQALVLKVIGQCAKDNFMMIKHGRSTESLRVTQPREQMEQEGGPSRA
jgi:hypothetical protein